MKELAITGKSDRKEGEAMNCKTNQGTQGESPTSTVPAPKGGK